MSERDDLPVFRPKIGGKGGARPSRTPSFRGAVLAAMRGARVSHRPAAPSNARRSGGMAARVQRSTSRRVVVKARVVKMTAHGKKAAALHLKYIERDGVEKDGSPGRLYGADGLVKAEDFAQPLPGEPHQFRLIVSPEDASELDLTDYVRRYVARIEKDLDRKLHWAAVNHYDTDHPHAHVVIRGVDQDGIRFRLDRDYVSRGLRERAQELATDQLGPRQAWEVERQRAREVTQERLTSLDRDIARRAQGDMFELGEGRGVPSPRDALLVQRLQHLEGMQLVVRTSPSSWQLAPSWQGTLREHGERGDILKQMHKALGAEVVLTEPPVVVTRGKPLDVAALKGGGVVYGRIADKVFADEQRGDMVALLETPEGKAYRVPLTDKEAQEFKRGDVVGVSAPLTPRGKEEDRLIAINAQATGPHQVAGVYHVTETTPETHRRRLGGLEKLGLATRAGEAAWTVRPDFEAVLAAKDREEPSHRLRVTKEPVDKQVRYLGPVWLDELRKEALPERGFGAEVRRLLEQRAAVLSTVGIDPHVPVAERVTKLQELERRAYGEMLGKREQRTVVHEPPPDFKGAVHLVKEPAPSGQHYVEVREGRRFVLVAVTPEQKQELKMLELRGVRIGVARDAEQRLRLRGPDKDRGLGR